tara:strand:- start:230 stop:1237 length:1008 start_codon:yes stop_codon:yes gene_type:complete
MKVGVYTGRGSAAPFVMKEGNNKYSGIAIDIWERAAKDMDQAYYYVEAENDLDLAIKDLKDGVYDILIGPIALSEMYYKDVDFTQPWFLSNIKLVQEKYNNENDIIVSLVKFIFVLTGIAFLMLLFNAVFIKKSGDSRLSVMKLVSETMMKLLSGKLSSIKLSSSSRFLPIFNTLVILGVLLYIFMEFSKLFTSAKDKLLNIENKKVVVEFESTPLELARKHKAVPQQVYVDPKKIRPNRNIKLDTYLQNKRDFVGVLDTESSMKYYLNSGNPKYNILNMSDKTLGVETLAFPIKKYSPILEKLNRQLVENKDNKIHEIIVAKYVGSDIAKNANF